MSAKVTLYNMYRYVLNIATIYTKYSRHIVGGFENYNIPVVMMRLFIVSCVIDSGTKISEYIRTL